MTKKKYDTTPKTGTHRVRSHTRRLNGGELAHVKEYIRNNPGTGWSRAGKDVLTYIPPDAKWRGSGDTDILLENRVDFFTSEIADDFHRTSNIFKADHIKLRVSAEDNDVSADIKVVASGVTHDYRSAEEIIRRNLEDHFGKDYKVLTGRRAKNSLSITYRVYNR
jgi:hypothetical protein